MRRSSQNQRPSWRLARLRVEAGLTQIGLAEAAGVAASSVRHSEHGRVPIPPIQKAIADALSEALERPISALDLWEWIEDDEPNEAVA